MLKCSLLLESSDRQGDQGQEQGNTAFPWGIRLDSWSV